MLFVMFVVGFLLFQVAITGKLGSILGSFIAPADMLETQNGG